MKNLKIYMMKISLLMFSHICIADDYALKFYKNHEVCNSILFDINSDSANYIGKGKKSPSWEKISNKSVNIKYKPESAFFYHELTYWDIDNDSMDEIVIKKHGYLSGVRTNVLYVYEKNQIDKFDAINFSSIEPLITIDLNGGFYDLKELAANNNYSGEFKGVVPHESIGGMFYLKLFEYKGDTYIMLFAHTKNQVLNKWLPILKMDSTYNIEDVCYFKSDK